MTQPPRTAIATWFVADSAGEATFFPQVGSLSNAPATQAVYWRCVACFYASSVALNPGRRHVFFTNATLPIIDGVAFADLFAQWSVEVVTMPITYRLARGEVHSWGNQFYILDILRWIAERKGTDRWIVLDSDCVWIKPVDAMEQAIDAEGVLTYELDSTEHGADEAINGLSRQGMARFLARHGGPTCPSTPYHGGEIVAVRHEQAVRLAEQVPALWTATLAGADDAPQEEAHFLSILYALNGYRPGTANAFIRRIWTTLRHHNAGTSDRALTIWHVPAAKVFGFRTLFGRLARAGGDWRDPAALGFTQPTYERLLGVPRAPPTLTIEMTWYKLRERLRKLRRRRA